MKAGSVYGEIKGDFRQQGKTSDGEDIVFQVGRQRKTFYQKKTVNRHGYPAHKPEADDDGGDKRFMAFRADQEQGGHKYRADMVQQHGKECQTLEICSCQSVSHDIPLRL